MSDATVETDAARLIGDLGSLERERLAFSAADVRGRVKVASIMRALGFQVRIDEFLNVVGVVGGTGSGLPPILIGSHLDTVANPGRFDGALGVLAGVEICRALTTADRRLRHPIMVVGFSDEEGTSSAGCLGSRGFASLLDGNEPMDVDLEAEGLAAKLVAARRQCCELSASANIAAMLSDQHDPRAPRPPKPAAYLEMHVEQGPVLERAGVPIGVVSSIAGIRRYAAHVPGKAGHAGTLPMADRDDAVLKACDLTIRLWNGWSGAEGRLVGNVGDITVSPGEFNVVPDRVSLAVEIRSPEDRLLDEDEADLNASIHAIGGTCDRLASDSPVKMSDIVEHALTRAAEEESLAAMSLPSWAGHDAVVFAPIVPTGMLFVPSVGGHSHCPQEHTLTEHIAAGVAVLGRTVCRLDEELDG
jgi:N-carbamoyl-L-amino-acid hydrolase